MHFTRSFFFAHPIFGVIVFIIGSSFFLDENNKNKVIHLQPVKQEINIIHLLCNRQGLQYFHTLFYLFVTGVLIPMFFMFSSKKLSIRFLIINIVTPNI